MTVEYADAVLAQGRSRRASPALSRRALAPLRYIDRGFDRTRAAARGRARGSLVFRRLEWIVSAVRERLRSDDPREEVAEALS